MSLSTFDFLKNSRTDGGFYLDDEQLKALQNALLSILADISELAEENGIPLYLSSGSVLGAVRHGGFIPWDDDIDVNLERRFYSDFISLLREKRSDRYWVHTPEDTHNYGLLSTRVRLKGTDVRLREDEYSNERGVCLDIFPIENTYDPAILRALQGVLSMGAGFLLSCRKFYRDRRELKKIFLEQGSQAHVYYIKAAVGFLVSWGSVDFWTHTARNAYAICRNDRSKYVSVPAGRGHFFRELYERASFCGRKKIRFEDGMYFCTSDPDSYMKALYGSDYMQIPPKEQQEKHLFFSFSIPESGSGRP